MVKGGFHSGLVSRNAPFVSRGDSRSYDMTPRNQ